MYKRVKRLAAKNKIAPVTEEDLQKRVYPQIAQLKDEVRQVKETCGKKKTPLFWSKVLDLVLLKHQYCVSAMRLGKDPAAVSGDPQIVPRMTHSSSGKTDLQCIPDTEIKLRWRLCSPDGSVVRLQRPIQLKATVTGKEIIDVIVAFTREKVPDAPEPVKFEVDPSVFRSHFIDSLTAAKEEVSMTSSSTSTAAAAASDVEMAQEEESVDSKKAFRAICEDDVFCLPLVFPGPRLLTSYTINVRVTYPFPTADVPAEYKTLPALPQLVDCGSYVTRKRPTEMLVEGDEEEEVSADDVIKRFDRVAVRAFASGVSQLVLTAEDVHSSRIVVDAAKRHGRSLFSAVGAHPKACLTHKLTEITSELRALCADADADGAVVAFGRICIDPSYTQVDVTSQTALFEAQLALANELGLPVIVDEGKEALASLRKAPPARGGIVVVKGDCDGSIEEYIKLGFFVGVSSSSASVCIAKLPVERIVFVSDSDGRSGANEPRALIHTLIAVAKVLGMPPEVLAQATVANARKALGLPAVVFSGVCGDSGSGGKKKNKNDFNAFGLGDLPPVVVKKRPFTDKEAAVFLRPGEVLVRIEDRTFACSDQAKSELFEGVEDGDTETLLKRATEKKLRELVRMRRKRGGAIKRRNTDSNPVTAAAGSRRRRKRCAVMRVNRRGRRGSRFRR